ncbi:MAG: beta-propeller domain-containing protein [Oscillospiraceae bacterium]|nr:beta-propeller domain-containing protein [Oscillospiraceae bacterium]
MGFDKEVRMLIEEAEIPERLSPDNIAVMLKEKQAEKNRKEIKMSSAGIKSKNRAVAMRSAAAVAACIALGCGVTAVVNNTNRPEIDNPEVIQGHKVSDYHDVYSVIQDTIINNPADDGIGWGEISNDEIPVETDTENFDNKDYIFDRAAETEDDITVTDGKNLYCISNGKVNVISAENGDMTELIQIENAEKTPVGMYIAEDRLIVISNNVVEVPFTAAETEETTAEGEEVIADSMTETTVPSLPETVTQNNTVIDIYNIADKTNVKLENTYKQNGAYISSSMEGTLLYVVSNYSNFRTKPLDSEEDLDNYIPSYYTDDGKYYVDAADITIPAKVSNNYTIVAGLDTAQASPFRSIKVVLSNGKSAYFTDNAVYVAGNASGDTTIAKFPISDGDISAPIVADVAGIYSDITSVDEYNGMVRVSTMTPSPDGARTGGVSISIYDENLVPVSYLAGLCKDMGKNPVMVEFKENKAFIFLSGESNPYEVILDGTEVSPVVSSDRSVYLYKCTDNEYLGISSKTDENGKAVGVVLTMYSTADGINFTELSSVETNGVLSAALSNGKLDMKALLIDSKNGIIGIPTVKNDTYGNGNLYYVTSYKSGEGFTSLGYIEYTDLDKKYEFKRSVVIDDTLYAVSDGRIVSARISDLKVVETLETE